MCFQPSRHKLRERRFAIAVGAEKADPVVIRNREAKPPQHRLLAVARARILHRDKRWTQRSSRRGQKERQDLSVDDGRHGFHLGEHFQARLGLRRFGRFGAEAIDERLKVPALAVLFLFLFERERSPRKPLSLKTRIIAAPEGELGLVEVQDMIANGIEQIAVMADDKDRCRIALKIIDQPERALEIEVIGRLVEKQKIGARKQNSGERDAHPPAAGKFGKRLLLRRFIEAKASQNARCPRGRRMRRNIDEARLNLADASRIGRGLGLGE